MRKSIEYDVALYLDDLHSIEAYPAKRVYGKHPMVRRLWLKKSFWNRYLLRFLGFMPNEGVFEKPKVVMIFHHNKNFTLRCETRLMASKVYRAIMDLKDINAGKATMVQDIYQYASDRETYDEFVNKDQNLVWRIDNA